MKSYVIYRRVSTEDQGRSGLGLEAQQRDIDLFLTTFSDRPWQVTGEFQDIQSGKDNDRPALAQALELCRSTGAELLISKLDRLSRKVSFVASLLDDKKLKLRVASMPHADKFQLHIYAALAEQERDFISARTKAALASAKAKGVKLGGLRPNTEARNVAIQQQANADAERLWGLIGPLKAQGLSLRGIARELDKQGVATSRGGVWSAKQVSNIVNRMDGKPSRGL